MASVPAPVVRYFVTEMVLSVEASNQKYAEFLQRSVIVQTRSNWDGNFNPALEQLRKVLSNYARASRFASASIVKKK